MTAPEDKDKLKAGLEWWTAQNTRLADLVDAVKKHARTNYEWEGWDYVIECWSDSEIMEVISKASTAEEAIALMKDEVAVLHDHREDAIAESGVHVQCPRCKHWRERMNMLATMCMPCERRQRLNY